MTALSELPSPILVIDDDEDTRALLKQLLPMGGYDVVVARHGLEGLQLARAQPPAVILLDLHMPVMNGVTFRQHQLADPALATIPVICVSALDGASRQVGEFGNVQFVGKPLDFDRLLACIEIATVTRAAAAPRHHGVPIAAVVHAIAC